MNVILDTKRIFTKPVFFAQDVVSCSAVSQGCNGGFKYLIAGRYAMEQGMVAEECNPYTAQVSILLHNELYFFLVDFSFYFSFSWGINI